MFVGRNRELSIIKSELRSKNNSAIIIYGRRRIGKTSLILEALKDYDGIKIIFTAAPDEIKENIAALSRLTGEVLGEAWMNFQSPKDYFQYLGKRKEKTVLVIDEYQDFRGKNKSDALVVDAALRDFIDYKKSNIKLIISGSAIRVLENILEDNTNPLFMRFTKVVNLKELDYLEASCFYSEASIMEKIAYYAVFGGLPSILTQLEAEKGIEGNIEDLILSQDGIARYYIESVIDKEINPINNGQLIIRRIGNGKKHYSEIEASISNERTRKQLSKGLKELTEAHLIKKLNPINRQNDKKKTFYSINCNLLRFHMAYAYGAEMTGTVKAYYKKYIEQSLNTFISYRFEDIAKQYFSSLQREDVIEIGTYWYDSKEAKTSGEFDIALETLSGYEIYEAKYYSDVLKKEKIRQELEKATKIEGLTISNFGLISASGFEKNDIPIKQISGDEIYRQK